MTCGGISGGEDETGGDISAGKIAAVVIVPTLTLIALGTGILIVLCVW